LASSCVRVSGRGSAWLLAAALFAACAGDAGDGRRPDPAEARAGGAFPDTVRGIVTLQRAGGATFQPCDAEGVYRVLEAPGADLDVAARRLVEPGIPLYAELQAETGPDSTGGPDGGFDGVLRVRRWVYLAEDAPGCARLEDRPAAVEGEAEGGAPLAADVKWRAQGNEPFWMAEVRADRIVVVRPGLDTVSVPAVEPGAEGTTRRWRAETETHALELVASEEACYDSMSGLRFDFVATLTLDGQELAGCARRGPAAEPEAAPQDGRAH
jgi:uncharacterized membrane protein